MMSAIRTIQIGRRGVAYLFLLFGIQGLGVSWADGGVVRAKESWDSTAAGWLDRDAGKMAVSHSAAVGQPAGSLAGVFAAQGGVPVPETDAFRATETSSGGGFTGNYWEHHSSFHGWSFDFRAGEMTPSTLQVRFGGAGSVFFANVLPQVGAAGGWRTIQTPTTHAGGWFGGTAAQWTNALAAVEWVEVQVARNGAAEQAYYLDNFDNNLPEIRDSALGDRVWFDTNGDGLQNAGENYAIQNLLVALLDATSNSVLATTATDANGRYLFSGLAASNYVVRFTISGEPSLMPSPKKQGSNPAVDSDAGTNTVSAGYAWTDSVALGMTETNLTIDLGLVGKDGTRAEVAAVWAEWTDGEARVVWRTSSEWGTAGFHVYRVDAETGVETRLTDELLLSKLSEAGALYSVADPQATEGGNGCYRLEELELSGRMRDLGRHDVEFVRAPAKAKTVRANKQKLVEKPRTEVASPFSEGVSDVLKVSICEEGIHAVSLRSIAEGMGYGLETVRVLAQEGSLAVTRQGVPVPVLYDNLRERLVFHGAPPAPNLITKESVYLISAKPGLVMPRREPGAASGATAFPVQVRFEQDLHLGNAALPAMPENLYYWQSFIASASTLGGRKSFPLALGGHAGGDVELRIRLMGWTSTIHDPDHRAEFLFNGSPVGSIEFDGQETVTAAVIVPGARVVNGMNTLVVKAALMDGRSHSLFALDWVDAAFLRTLAPRAGTLHFTPGGADAVSAAAFMEPLVIALDGDDQPTWIANGDGALPNKAWTVQDADERFAVAEASAIPLLEPMPAISDAWFLAETNRIDYLVIVSRALESAAQELVEYRAGQGLRTGVAVFEEICDLFAGGQRTPEAIPELLAYATRNWKESPWLVVLVGSGHYDYLGISSTKTNHLPPMMLQTRDGWCAADGQMSDLDGDGMPDIALGRLPAQTPGELAVMIAKIKGYESAFGSDWQNQLVLVSDATDTGNDFSAANDRLAQLVEAPFSVVGRMELDDLEVSEARSRIRDWFENGTGFIHFTGHGGVENMGTGHVLTCEDVDDLSATGRPPILVALSCLMARYEDPATASLSERLLSQSRTGAAAVLGPSGLSRNDPAMEWAEAFYRAVLKEGVGTLGQAFLQARRSLPGTVWSRETLAIYNLLGDPALRIAGRFGGNPSVGSFAQWRWQHLPPAELAECSLESSFFHYALGDEGGLALRAHCPGVGSPGSGFILEWMRRTEHADVEYQVMFSEDMRNWEFPEEGDLQTVEVTPATDGIMETVRSRLCRTNAVKQFMGIQAIRK